MFEWFWWDSGQWSAHLFTHSGQKGKQLLFTGPQSPPNVHTHTRTHSCPQLSPRSPVCSEDVCSLINLNTAPRFPRYLFEQLREELTLALCTIARGGFGNRPLLLLRPFCWRGPGCPEPCPLKSPCEDRLTLAGWSTIKKKGFLFFF